MKLPKDIRAGDTVINAKGERRLVIDTIPRLNELTFSGDPKWYSTREWERDHSRANVCGLR